MEEFEKLSFIEVIELLLEWKGVIKIKPQSEDNVGDINTLEVEFEIPNSGDLMFRLLIKSQVRGIYSAEISILNYNAIVKEDQLQASNVHEIEKMIRDAMERKRKNNIECSIVSIMRLKSQAYRASCRIVDK